MNKKMIKSICLGFAGAILLSVCNSSKKESEPITTIKNVRFFDGEKLSDPTMVSFSNGVIIEPTEKADNIIDAEGGTLLPGFIDSHIHLDHLDNLKDATKWGITTMIDMKTESYELVNELRNQEGLTDIRSSLRQVISPYGPVFKQVLGELDFATRTPEDARKRIDEQVAQGADFIKLVIEQPPLVEEAMPNETVQEAVNYAHKKGKQVFVHATRNSAYELAVNSGADVLNHLPKDELLTPEIIKTIKDKNIYVVPTLIMLKGTIESDKKRDPNNKGDMSFALQNLSNLYKAGVTIIAGTDANKGNKMNYILHGPTLHTEFELMSEAGMSNVDILRSATIVPAGKLKFSDRGSIEVGKRADLVLIKGNPLEDIKNTQNIQKVWIKGVEAKTK